jgi:predicted transcriptional regulator
MVTLRCEYNENSQYSADSEYSVACSECKVGPGCTVCTYVQCAQLPPWSSGYLEHSECTEYNAYSGNTVLSVHSQYGQYSE